MHGSYGLTLSMWLKNCHDSRFVYLFIVKLNDICSTTGGWITSSFGHKTWKSTEIFLTGSRCPGHLKEKLCNPMIFRPLCISTYWKRALIWPRLRKWRTCSKCSTPRGSADQHSSMLDGAMTACLMLCNGRRRKLREQSLCWPMWKTGSKTSWRNNTVLPAAPELCDQHLV